MNDQELINEEARILFLSPLQELRFIVNERNDVIAIEHYGVRFSPVIKENIVMWKCRGGLSKTRTMIEMWSDCGLMPRNVRVDVLEC